MAIIRIAQMLVIAFFAMSVTTSSNADTRIVERSASRDLRLNIIAQRLGKFGGQRDRSFGLDGRLPADRDLVYPIVDRFLSDIGGYRIKTGYGFILRLRRASIVPPNRNTPIARDMISAQIVDNAPNANGQVLMSSSLEVECSKDSYTYGCELSSSLIEELLYRLAR